METEKDMHFFLVTEFKEKNHTVTIVLIFTFCLTTGYWSHFTLYLVGHVQHARSLKCRSEITACQGQTKQAGVSTSIWKQAPRQNLQSRSLWKQ